MSRPCGWCGHPDRVALEERVLRGESIQSVSVSANLPHWPSAGHRHFRGHVRPELRRVARTHVADFAQRLMDLADDAAEQGAQGRAGHDPKLVLAALRAEREVLGELSSVLGITHEEIIEQLGEARALILAICDVVRDSRPELAEHLARELDRRDQPELADSLRGLARDQAAVLNPPSNFAPKELQ